jgi:hypothetical protein
MWIQEEQVQRNKLPLLLKELVVNWVLAKCSLNLNWILGSLEFLPAMIVCQVTMPLE